MKKQILFFPVLILLLSVCLIEVAATIPVDTTADVSFQVSLRYDGTGIPGAAVSIYRIADANAAAELTLCAQFAAFDGDFEDLKRSRWNDLAIELSEWIEDQGIAPEKTDLTGSQGKLKFNDHLKPGLFLLSFGEFSYAGKKLTALPCLIALPFQSSETGEWIYQNNPVVIKAGDWKGNSSLRGWSRINPAEENAVSSSSPEMTSPLSNDAPEQSEILVESNDTIPQTGMNWFPVILLGSGGLICLIIGTVRRREDTHEA